MGIVHVKMNTKKTRNNKSNIGEHKYVKKFRIPIYDRELKIIVCDDIKIGLDYISYEDLEGEEDWFEATVIEDSRGIINVIIKPDATINTICHESLHVVTAILGNAGLELCEKSEEAYAYLLGFIAERIEKAIHLYIKTEPDVKN
jgi:hypothetical protein